MARKKKIAKNVIFTKFSLKISSLKCWNRKRWEWLEASEVEKSRDIPAASLSSWATGGLRTPSLSSWWEVSYLQIREILLDTVEGTGNYQMSVTLPFSHPLFVTIQYKASSYSSLWQHQVCFAYPDYWEPLVVEPVCPMAQLCLLQNSVVHQYKTESTFYFLK